MTDWKKNGNYPESKFAIEFREDHPEIAKLLSDEKGYYVTGKTATHEGYTYKVKMITSKKDGKSYTLVEREKADMIVGVRGEKGESYNEGAKKGHEENMQAHKEHMDKMNILITALVNLNETIHALREEMRLQAGEKKQ